MSEHPMVGTKYLWCGPDCVLEMHGKEKKSWTHLEDHVFRNTIPADNLEFYQDRFTDNGIARNRLVFHALRLSFKLKLSTV